MLKEGLRDWHDVVARLICIPMTDPSQSFVRLDEGELSADAESGFMCEL